MLHRKKNHPERKPNRLGNYNYASDGFYFVTICVQDRKEYFGEIKNQKMVLNKYGNVVQDQWLWFAKQYQYVKLYEYIVMPDHVHGILQIENQISPRVDEIEYFPPELESNDTIKIKPLSELIGAFKTTS